ncbi:MAG: PAS domain-containing protein [Candidatus Omnitrophica bacterium]|nr:PAS domain-containing protein [Candidatus Omnitrophota bacterium]
MKIKLGYKILINILFIIAMLSLASIFAISYSLEKLQQDRLKTAEVLFAKSLSEKLFREVIESKVSVITSVLFEEKKLREEKIEYILVFNEKGYLLSHTYLGAMPREILKLHDNFSEGEKYRIKKIVSKGFFVYDIAVPVMEGIKEVGTLHVGIKGSYVENLINAAATSFLIVISIVTVIAVFLSLLMSAAIVRPVTKLNSALIKVSRGDLDTNIEVESKDEIGELGASFNKMTADLKSFRDNLFSATKYTESIISSMVDALVVVNPDGEIRSVNKSTCDLLGYREEELAGKEFGLIFAREETAAEIAAEVLEQIKDPALLISRDFRITGINGAAVEMLGRKKKDVIGQFCYKVMHGSKDICHPLLDKCPILEGTQENKPCVEMHPHFDEKGNRVMINAAAVPLADSLGSSMHYLHITRRASNGYLSRNGTLEETGRLAQELKKYARKMAETIEQKLVFDKTGLQRLTELGSVKNLEVQYKTKNGENIPVNFSASVMRDNDNNLVGVVGVARDMRQTRALIASLERSTSELRDLYTDLQNTHEMLVQAEKMTAVGQLASGVAHEVRNPLGIMLQGVNYLESRLSNSQEDISETLATLKESVRRADKIIDGLLDFSRFTKLELQQEDINSILENSLVLVRNQFKVENIEIIKELKSGLPGVLADKNKLEQVFINVLLNAVQAMPKGGRITIRSYEKKLGDDKNDTGKIVRDNFRIGEQVVIAEFEDTGIGIPEENIGKIFDPFFTTKGPKSGTGLGLSVSRNILQMHKGLIYAESRYGKGTKITVILKTAGRG